MRWFQILVLVISSFSSTILASFFPEDIDGHASFFVVIIQTFLLIGGACIFFLLKRWVNEVWGKRLLLLGLSICISFFSLSIFPCSAFCPSDFTQRASYILKEYDEVSLNNYKSSYRSEDVMMNNAVLYKFKMPDELYTIEYLDIREEGLNPASRGQYPIWMINGKALYDRRTLSVKKVDNYLLFTDSINGEILSFKIGVKGLNEVEDFYTGGGSEIVNGRKMVRAGVVDQGYTRIIVNKNDPAIEVNSSYGKLMRMLLRMKKSPKI